MRTNRLSKAFDTVDHVILARKLFGLKVPVFIIQWIMSFLTHRSQASTSLRCCPLTDQLFKVLALDRLHNVCPRPQAIGQLNYLIKYADDATLALSRIGPQVRVRVSISIVLGLPTGGYSCILPLLFCPLRGPKHQLNLRWPM